MKTLIIVPCGQSKIWEKNPTKGPTYACNAYTGTPFKINREYAEKFADTWMILSAKYGFISPDYKLSGPYNVTFKKKLTNPVSLSTLQEQVKVQNLDQFDVIIGLGGKEYRQMIKQAFLESNSNIVFPFAGLQIGKMMQATKKAIASNEPFYI